GPVPQPALRRAAAAGGGGARGDRQAQADPRRRADGEPALGAGTRDHGAVQEAQRRGDDHRAGHPLGAERRLRAAGDQPERRLDGLVRPESERAEARRRATPKRGAAERPGAPEPTRASGKKRRSLAMSTWKHALRGLAKSPALVIVAVVTLALGIGP